MLFIRPWRWRNKKWTIYERIRKLAKLEPNKRVQKTNEFIKLLEDPAKDINNPQKLNANEKSELYGIKVEPLNELFTAYYMKETKLIGGNKKEIHSNDRIFPVLKKINFKNWLCFHEKCNYDDAETLYNTLSKASKAFNLKISEPEWVEMPNKSKAQDWIETIDEYIDKNNNKNKYDFVIFLLGRNDSIYPQLKKHSLCTNGYISQVVKVRSIQKKGAMSICSKILLQINAKLRGISYKAITEKEVNERKLMIIGVDSSHIEGKRTGIAMVATINEDFTDFFN